MKRQLQELLKASVAAGEMAEGDCDYFCDMLSLAITQSGAVIYLPIREGVSADTRQRHHQGWVFKDGKWYVPASLDQHHLDALT